eukprot:Amastigsp_a339633_37.p2 type:complete len:265 gc:universal Amastigsp_a339633_37:563-1357(+)
MSRMRLALAIRILTSLSASAAAVSRRTWSLCAISGGGPSVCSFRISASSSSLCAVADAWNMACWVSRLSQSESSSRSRATSSLFSSVSRASSFSVSATTRSLYSTFAASFERPSSFLASASATRVSACASSTRSPSMRFSSAALSRWNWASLSSDFLRSRNSVCAACASPNWRMAFLSPNMAPMSEVEMPAAPETRARESIRAADEAARAAASWSSAVSEDESRIWWPNSRRTDETCSSGRRWRSAFVGLYERLGWYFLATEAA